jgi:hypothetical protein
MVKILALIAEKLAKRKQFPHLVMLGVYGKIKL